MSELKTVPESNSDWAAQQLATNLTKDEIWILQDQLKVLDKVLYKSWAKQLTLSELIEAVDMANEAKRM